MEFSLDAFFNALFNYLLDSKDFPYMKDESLDRSKHSKREPLHLKNAIRQHAIKTYGGDTIRSFDIGSEMLEHSHPYYHILQQAPVIRKSGKGTKKTKGSQALVEDVGKRDYERVGWNGKTFTKEYTRNVRGSRNRTQNVSHWIEVNGKKEFVNREANAYANRHYQYIDKILNGEVVDRLALEFNLKKTRVKNEGLGEENILQIQHDAELDSGEIYETIMSHDIGG